MAISDSYVADYRIPILIRKVTKVQEDAQQNILGAPLLADFARSGSLGRPSLIGLRAEPNLRRFFASSCSPIVLSSEEGGGV
jgi:hypothetical protein